MRFSYVIPVGTLVQYTPMHKPDSTPRRKVTDRELRLSDFHCKDSKRLLFRIETWDVVVIEKDKVEIIPNTPKRGGFTNGMI